MDVTTRLQGKASMQVNRNYKGMFCMTEEYEKFEFIEQAHSRCERNPTVWAGDHINVHKNKDGRYTIQMKQRELTGTFDPCTFAEEVFLDVERAKMELGL